MGIFENHAVKTFSVSVMMTVILMCCSSQMQAAQEGDFTYTLTNGKAEITGYSGSGGAVVIPSTIGGFPVSSIGNLAFYNCTGLTGIDIPEGVTIIGSSAFDSCTGLTGITVPSSVTRIKMDAFNHCSGLNSVTLTKGLTRIDDDAFYGCIGLTSITIPESVTYIGDGVFNSCSGLTSIAVDANNSSYTSIEGVLYDKAKAALVECPGGLTSVAIPEGVTSISNYAFYGCTGLTNITIPGSVNSIGGCAFDGCTGLKEIVIPSGVTGIESIAFQNCTSLTSVSLPGSVTSIGTAAFNNCTSLTDITLPQGLTVIGGGAFSNCKALTDIIIPEGVTGLGGAAFARCTGLTGMIIPESVAFIGAKAFIDCSNLTSITFKSATTIIGEPENTQEHGSTIPVATKIIGYDPSAAKTWAEKYDRTFEVISGNVNTDTGGMTEMTTASPTTVKSDYAWTIKLSGPVNEASLTGQIYVADSQGIKQTTTCTVANVNGCSQIKVAPTGIYTSGNYTLFIRDIESVKGIKIKNQVYLKFTVE